MSDFEKDDLKKTITALKTYRSGWANDIREGWDVAVKGAKEITFELYEVSGCIILALEQLVKGSSRDKMAMIMVRAKLEALVKSEIFSDFDSLGEAGICNVVTSGTKHHIRVMFDCLDTLTD
ncbi:MAG: hypothetical protein IKS23_04280 [Alphaproteobacteria bacterium]|nr:hypothetical protein [Alphaproteobacteria bacterium]